MLQLLLAAALLAPPDSIAVGDTTTAAPLTAGPSGAAARVAFTAPVDTSRPRAFSYSDGYELRQTIHKRASFATLPLFAIQFAAGTQLFDKSTDAPEWAKRVHGPAATGVATLFAVNTVTGVWNLWEARPDPEGRVRRTTHGLLMLLSDAGFTYTGMLAEQAERSPDKRRLHRQVALSSMAVATASYLVMALPFWE